MPINKNARLQQLISLSQTPAEDALPMIDRQTILENSELPNVEEILARFEAIKQQQAQQSEASSQAMLQEQQANIQMSAEAEMQKAEQKHNFEMQKEQMKYDIEKNKDISSKEEKAKDRELQLIQMLMNKQTEQTSEDTNNINNEEANNTETVDNNVDNVNEGEEELIKLIEYVMSLPPEEQQALLEQYPELAEAMTLIQQEAPTM